MAGDGLGKLDVLRLVRSAKRPNVVVADEQPHRSSYAGRTDQAKTPLTPGGISGRRELQAESIVLRRFDKRGSDAASVEHHGGLNRAQMPTSQGHFNGLSIFERERRSYGELRRRLRRSAADENR